MRECAALRKQTRYAHRHSDGSQISITGASQPHGQPTLLNPVERSCGTVLHQLRRHTPNHKGTNIDGGIKCRRPHLETEGLLLALRWPLMKVPKEEQT